METVERSYRPYARVSAYEDWMTWICIAALISSGLWSGWYWTTGTFIAIMACVALVKVSKHFSVSLASS
jgi:hypothetical protein